MGGWGARVVLGLSLAHSSLLPSGPLHSLSSNLWRKEFLPLVFLTAFSRPVVQFRGPDLAVARASEASPALVCVSCQRGNSIPKARGLAQFSRVKPTYGFIKNVFCLKHPMHMKDALCI